MNNCTKCDGNDSKFHFEICNNFCFPPLDLDIYCKKCETTSGQFHCYKTNTCIFPTKAKIFDNNKEIIVTEYPVYCKLCNKCVNFINYKKHICPHCNICVNHNHNDVFDNHKKYNDHLKYCDKYINNS